MRAPLILLLLSATPVTAGSHVDGRTLYLERCATCHGEDADGRGPMAALLTVPVPGLTGLAAGNGGDFPLLDVIAVIDGRVRPEGHGGPAPMPVFGPILGGGSAVVDGPDGTPVQTSGEALALARYLQAIQVAGQ